jgi:hypothetical protein
VPGWYLTLVTLKLAGIGADHIWTTRLVFRLSGVNTTVTERTFALSSGASLPGTGDWLTLWMVRKWTTSETARLTLFANAAGSSLDTGSLIQMIQLSRDE